MAPDVIKALMDSTKVRCASLGSAVDIESIEEITPEDDTSSPSTTRSVVHFSCIRNARTTEPAIPEATTAMSLVPDLARGKTQVIPLLEEPASAELPIFSTDQGEPAGIVPTAEQRAFLERDVDLEPQSNSRKRNQLYK